MLVRVDSGESTRRSCRAERQKRPKTLASAQRCHKARRSCDKRGSAEPRSALAGRRGSGGCSDQLLVDELLRAEAAEFPAEARALRPAERQLDAVRADEVDVDHAGVDLV